MVNKKYICDCGVSYVPKLKYKDNKVKCSECIKSTKASDVKARCVEYLGGKCVDCGYDKHVVALDFDHIDPSKKEFKISGHYIYRWKELKKELDRCEIRCSNCHRIKHYLEDFPEEL